MREATRWHTWKGHCVERISATAIKSHSSAQKFGPFVDEARKPLLWVGWGHRQDGKAIPPYFRHWPKDGLGRQWFPTFEQETEELEATKRESDIHRKAKDVCISLLSKMIQEGRSLPWCFKDSDSSDFPLSGNLLAEVAQVQGELAMKTPFAERKYRFDVGLLGEKILRKPQLLGAIEFELSSRIGIWKTALCKALGFPLVSVNLTGFTLADITEEWCFRILTETTQTSDRGRRRNYFFLHTMLYPVFLDIPKPFRAEDRHRFVVFASDAELWSLKDLLQRIELALGLPRGTVLIQPRPNKNAETQKQMQHEGSMAGHDWKSYNDHFYLRISVDVPVSKAGPLYRLHLALAHLLNCKFDCLVGYKYQPVVFNPPEHQNIPVWTHRQWSSASTWTDHNIAPKHLSQPLRPIREYLALRDDERQSNAGSLQS